MLSVVLPVRVTAETAYLLERLEGNLALLGRHEGVECVVVDSASEPPYGDEVRALCEGAGARHVEDPAPLRPFAPGATRNVGARAASGAHVLFYDVDLCCQADFVPRVREWTRRIQSPAEFLMIPCLYLTREATEQVRFAGAPVDLAPFATSLLEGDNRLVAHVAVSTSTVVVARRHFLAIGGNRHEYRGHGCEDFDLLHRLASYHPIGPRPADYYEDVKATFPGDYRGFRGYLARYALPHLFDGLVTAHLWHPRPLQRSYFRRRRANENLLQELLRQHDARGASGQRPAPWSQAGGDPLPDLPTFIAELQRQRGFDPERFPGLFRWRAGTSRPSGTAGAKLRKLALNPRAFFADSKISALRRLRHLFPRR